MRYTEVTPIGAVPGVGDKTIKSYDRLGIKTVGDLLRWYPRRYIDAKNPFPIGNSPYGIPVAIRGRVKRADQKYSQRTRIKMTEVIMEDGTGELVVRWFNQPYLMKRFIPGSEWTLVGEIQYFGGKRTMASPTVEDAPGVFPVYPQTEGLTTRMIRQHVEDVLTAGIECEESLPEEVVTGDGLMGKKEATRAIHQPHTIQEAERAQFRIAFEEVFFFFLRTKHLHLENDQAKGIRIPFNLDRVKGLVENLPFTLTPSQKRAVWDSLQNMDGENPMTRLLNGDVGSGKTVVAALLAAVVAQAGYQTILLVPTEILANQHRERIEQLLGPQFRYALWTASQKDATEDAQIIVGTHAVLYDAFSLPYLALVVIDEQHRFGVKQRQHLRKDRENPPHVLSMTATPIPRTLALTLFSDLKVSILNQKPAGRKPIITELVMPKGRDRMRERMYAEVKNGNQIVVVCPLIESGESDGPSASQEKAAVQKVAERLQKEDPGLGVIEIVHGKLSPAQKQSVMDRMANGEIQVLVATSVIEVGIDLPKLSTVVIEGAESFGLAQLHQLRGRVGRGGDQGYCFLCPSVPSSLVLQRLNVLVRSQNGFDIAEADLELRGPGDLTGLSQSGLPDFRMARITDLAFLQHVKEVVDTFVDRDPRYFEKIQFDHDSFAGAFLE